MRYRKLIILLLTFSLIFTLPISAWAQDADAKDEIPPVPISDKALRAKEVGITIFGITLCVPATSLCITLDSITTAVAKLAIQLIIEDTKAWINNGFQGGPVYATDPGKYFGKVADNVAGEFIKGSDLAFLCSPFQAKIRLALLQYHTKPRQFQCSLSQVVGNIEGFYNNFSQGGWNGWLAMTQNDANNPYGAYLEAKVELDSRVARAVGLENRALTINRDFFNWKDCIRYEQDAQGQNAECIEYGPTITPGIALETQLEGVLGTGLKQLELADEVDELIGVLFTQLLKQTVFGVQGLFR